MHHEIDMCNLILDFQLENQGNILLEGGGRRAINLSIELSHDNKIYDKNIQNK